MKPSDILLVNPCPLVATFGRAERESAAAMLVYVLALVGDEWASVTGGQVADCIRAKHEAGELPDWATNPFLTPDVPGLIEFGAVEVVSRDPMTYRFTAAGLDALRRSRWNQEGARGRPREATT